MQGAVFAQSTTNVSITGIPGILPSPFLSDFEQNVYNGVYQVQADVGGDSSVDVRFQVTVSKDDLDLIDETSLPVELNPGMNSITPFPDYVEFSKTTNQLLDGLPSGMTEQVIQGGTFPEGTYTINIQAYETGSNIPAGSAGTATFMVRYPQSSTLLTPANADKVEVSYPVFSWTAVMAPQGTTIEYDFLLVEVYDGQNPGDALVSNKEHASIQVIDNTTISYSGEYLPLEPGKTYAWQVTAHDTNDQIPIKNNGKSEIHTFTYHEEEIAEVEDSEHDEINNVPVSIGYQGLMITGLAAPETLVPGDTVPITATVENTGDVEIHGADVSLTMFISHRGQIHEYAEDIQPLEISPGQSREVEFFLEVPDRYAHTQAQIGVEVPGDVHHETISAGYQGLTVTGLAAPETLVPGDTVPITATVENTGDVEIHGADVSLTMFISHRGQIHEYAEDIQPLEISPGQSREVEFFLEVPDWYRHTEAELLVEVPGERMIMSW